MYIIHCYTKTGFITEGSYRTPDLHKDIGPAYLLYDSKNGNIRILNWSVNSESHRIWDNPSTLHFLNGNIIYASYSINGKKHREAWPAVIYYTKDSKIEKTQFFLNNKEYIYEKFIQTPEYLAYLKKESINIFD